MSWGTYGILVIFGLFVLLMILNPRLSCFGKRIRSPFYPLLRKRQTRISSKKGEDYGFRLEEGEAQRKPGEKKAQEKKTEDYGFRLD